MKKKKWIISVLAVAILTGWVMYRQIEDKKAQNQYLHATINGTILSYEETSDGLYFLIDDRATTSDKKILVTQDTMYTDSWLEQSILNQKTGLYITVESEYWTMTYNSVYPAILISPGP